MNNSQTIGNPIYFSTNKLSDNSILNSVIIDTPGQAGYRSLTENYYKKADCCILVYDITNRWDFDDIENYYIETIKQKCKENVIVILVGNKIDLEKTREISYNEGAQLAFLNNYLFIETSCLENKNVSKVFEKIFGIGRFFYKNNEENLNEKKVLDRNELFILDLKNKKYINKLSKYIKI